MAFKHDTVFVVGAGASCEFGLPLGSELSTRIVDNLTVIGSGHAGAHYKDRRAENLLRQRYQSDNTGLDDAFNAGLIIKNGILHAQSIDAFIDMHSEKPAIAIVGKLQIALEILRAERASTLMVDYRNRSNRINFEQSNTTWLRPFTEILLEKARVTDLGRIGLGLTVICFNYDRCIEHYLLHAIEATLSIPYDKAHEVMSQLNIIHPYGSLGPLPTNFGDKDGLPFGADVDQGGVDIWEVAGRLSTFTEEISDLGQLDRIRSAIKKATTLVCLGFGFQSQNVQLLTSRGSQTTKVVRMLSTGIGIHDVAVGEVISRMKQILRPHSSPPGGERVMIDVGCGNFMRHNRLGLSAA